LVHSAPPSVAHSLHVNRQHQDDVGVDLVYNNM
jgi:hypothetical protein